MSEEMCAAFDVQNRTVLTFSLLLVMRANALQTKNRVIARDFLRSELQKHHVTIMSHVQLENWLTGEGKDVLEAAKKAFIERQAAIETTQTEIKIQAKQLRRQGSELEVSQTAESREYEIGRAVQQECRDRSRMPSSA
eukprot:TRINITY_DN63928_c0_g1_i1.p1 TRINITY_DN63928_c0_g1~~TRINITY_DN63928_c0_g1_i1.p1  ORF type:complete len:145 (-),score=23.69 TRINITY_DN63928_c0_g1_i1:10-423(-)